MTRAVLIIGNDGIRKRARHWIDNVPLGTRITFQAPKRTTDQNARMWALLTDFAAQVDHGGRRYSPEEWKTIFMHALGQEMRFVPSLDGRTFVPIGMRTSELSVAEMIELQDLIEAEGAKRGVKFHAIDALMEAA